MKTRFSQLLMILVACSLLFSACQKEEVLPETNGSSLKMKVYTDRLESTSFVIAGSESLNLIVSFESTTADGTELQFSASDAGLPLILEDNEGNIWNVFGEAVSGPRQGERLQASQSGMGYWFAFAAHYPGLGIFNEAASAVVRPASMDPDWNIPTDSLVWASSWDGIRPINEPVFEEYKQRNHLQGYLLDQHDLIVGMKMGEEVKAYPHKILNWHEIVNDEVDGKEIAVSFCPLAGTASIWDVSGSLPAGQMAVSGVLYNNNLLMFDRETESIWSQILGRAVYGDRKGEAAIQYPFIETTWQTWQKIVELPLVLTDQTGVNYDYSESPYLNYIEDEQQIYYPLEHTDHRLPAKERVHLIRVGDQAKAYRLSDF